MGISRVPIPEAKRCFSVKWPEYTNLSSEQFDHPAVVEQWKKNGSSGWADSPDIRAQTHVNAPSYLGPVHHDENGYPLNPMGRTGIPRGRGVLGKWGVNQAADAVVFRSAPVTGLLEVLLIVRCDTGTLALPGGFVDAPERGNSHLTASRELKEEAGIELSFEPSQRCFAGYIDDSRNTDNAWIESAGYCTFLGDSLLALRAGDDATDARWVTVTPLLLKALFANHSEMVKAGMEKLGLVEI